jgi:hypothetical protein
LSTEHDPRVERRKSARICPKGSVIATAPTWARRARIANLSTGGVLLAMHTPLGEVGDKLAIELRLDGAVRDWLQLSGRLTRVERAGIAIAFEQVPEDFARLMIDVAGASQAHDRRLSVVLVDEVTDRRLAMAEAFRAAGCIVMDFATPLQVIVELGESDFESDLIAIGDGTSADELRGFVEGAHPDVKLVRIGDDAIEPIGPAHWLSTANPDDDLVSRIRVLLGRHR